MDIGGGSRSIMSPLMNGLLLSAFGLLLRKQTFRPSCEFVFFWQRILRWFSLRSWIVDSYWEVCIESCPGHARGNSGPHLISQLPTNYFDPFSTNFAHSYLAV